jgi:DsbC/DsbD-like thiol-disulfide interchange protein
MIDGCACAYVGGDGTGSAVNRYRKQPLRRDRAPSENYPMALLLRTNIPKAVLLAVVAWAVPTVNAGPFDEEPDGSALVQPRLVLEELALAPGSTAHLGVVFRIDPGWHIYWRNSGDTGLPPNVKLSLPAGLTAGPIEWPMPERYVHSDLLDYIYRDEVMLIVPIEVASDVRPGKALIEVSLDWLVCEESCLPGAGRASLEVAVAPDDKRVSKNSKSAALFAATRARLPLPMNEAWRAGVTVSWDGLSLVLRAGTVGEMIYYPAGPRRAPAVEPLRDTRAAGGEMSVEYDERVAHAPLVTGVLEVKRNGNSRYYWIEVVGPGD